MGIRGVSVAGTRVGVGEEQETMKRKRKEERQSPRRGRSRVVVVCMEWILTEMRYFPFKTKKSSVMFRKCLSGY